MRKTLLAGIAIAALSISGCVGPEGALEVVEETAVEEAPSVTEPEAEADGSGDIIEVLVANGSFETLVTALTAVGLVDMLQEPGPFTALAPTDEAFAALPEGLLEFFLLEENREVLAAIVGGHVVSDKVVAADFTSVEGAVLDLGHLQIDTSDGAVVNDSATVTITDLEASNGVIHVVDAVIVPLGLDSWVR